MNIRLILKIGWRTYIKSTVRFKSIRMKMNQEIWIFCFTSPVHLFSRTFIYFLEFPSSSQPGSLIRGWDTMSSMSLIIMLSWDLTATFEISISLLEFLDMIVNKRLPVDGEYQSLSSMRSSRRWIWVFCHICVFLKVGPWWSERLSRIC